MSTDPREPRVRGILNAGTSLRGAEEVTAVLVLSPHLDDALFSSHALISAGHPEVWTVFAGAPSTPGVTDWDRGCGFNDSRDLMAARREEDRAAFATLPGVAFRHLDLLERAYTTPQRRAEDLATLRRELEAWAEGSAGKRRIVVVPVGAGTRMSPGLVDVLRRVLQRGRSSAVSVKSVSESDRASGRTPEVPSASASPAPAAPSIPAPRSVMATLQRRARDAVRGVLHADFQRRRRAAQRRGMLANEDHTTIRDLAVDLFAQSPDVEVWFYEELPYLWGERGDAAARRLSRRTPLTERRWVVDPETKAHTVRKYTTQLGLLDPEHRELQDASTLPAYERIWIPAHASVPESLRALSLENPDVGEEELLPGVSVVIPAHHAAHTIGMQLEALAVQRDAPPFEVIVVENRSREDLRAALAPWKARLPQLTLLHAQKHVGASYARNVGLGAARYRNVAFCDADDVVSATWLRDLSTHLAQGPAVTGSARPLESDRFTSVAEVHAWLDAEEGHAVHVAPAPHDYPILMAGDSAFDTTFLRSLGGFDQSFVRGGEDNDLALRVIAAGKELLQSTGARLAYRDRPSTNAAIRKEWWRGFMHSRLATRHDLWTTSPHLGRHWYWELPRALGAALLMGLGAKPRDTRGVARRIATASGIAVGYVWHRVLGRDPGKRTGVGVSEGGALRAREMACENTGKEQAS